MPHDARLNVWIKEGKIAQVGGDAPGFAKETVNADGLIVAPGVYRSTHTHYDAQIRWDPYCTISGWHGVTSVVLGNCGFCFAPVKPDFRERSMLTMTRTEAIPYESMKAGYGLGLGDDPTIHGFYGSLDQRRELHSVYANSSSLDDLRHWVWKQPKIEPATETERKEMKRLLHEGMESGLCGFSFQRLGPDSTQADYDGTPMVTDTMADADISQPG